MAGTFQFKHLIAAAALGALLSGCGRGAKVAGSDFDIPPSLIHRMEVDYNANRNKMTGMTGTLDGNEMMALMKLGYAEAWKIAERPRGEMAFVDDGLDEEERRKLWPFDVEPFEKTLEAKLGRDEHGLPCMKDNEGSLFPFNPTMRAINEQMEHWAVRQLDAVFTRLDAGTYAKMTGEPENGDDEVLAWVVSRDGNEYFAMERGDGAWNLRSYMFLLWDGREKPTLYAEFDSFPTRKEAVAVRTSRHDCRGLHNMAVLYWRHQVFPLQFDPREIQKMLQIAQRGGVDCAKANLAVLKAHIPEVDQ